MDELLSQFPMPPQSIRVAPPIPPSLSKISGNGVGNNDPATTSHSTPPSTPSLPSTAAVVESTLLEQFSSKHEDVPLEVFFQFCYGPLDGLAGEGARSRHDVLEHLYQQRSTGSGWEQQYRLDIERLTKKALIIALSLQHRKIRKYLKDKALSANDTPDPQVILISRTRILYNAEHVVGLDDTSPIFVELARPHISAMIFELSLKDRHTVKMFAGPDTSAHLLSEVFSGVTDKPITIFPGSAPSERVYAEMNANDELPLLCRTFANLGYPFESIHQMIWLEATALINYSTLIAFRNILVSYTQQSLLRILFSPQTSPRNRPRHPNLRPPSLQIGQPPMGTLCIGLHARLRLTTTRLIDDPVPPALTAVRTDVRGRG
ncbi:hypothetical protein EJ05DRAFT_481952 [Pseudovirgaria hyperparasitica]|uniref:Uncharacterized protein n=1 Tax=Pseudovirgaria hyperparasitica TaxID=470096 RepID=A0A6A6WLS4_9PEZI|nr:uncharacterized protein EJ05DRAFT_481952 [Pseudovirgaria hyperparasitica]KAF2763112.1 hypothetical protein EJ05DRAFT_481952 [Pseudovirgaria hyperparasitica]